MNQRNILLISSGVAMAIVALIALVSMSSRQEITSADNFAEFQTQATSQDTQFLSDATNPTPNQDVTLMAVGDILLARTVEDKAHQHGWHYPFSEVTEIISSADFAIANLETPLIEGTTTPAYHMIFRADLEAAQALSNAGFDLVALANNHMNNYGSSGITSTRNELYSANIKFTGAGDSLNEALEPAFVTIKGMTFGFLAFTDPTFTANGDAATDSSSGVAMADIDLIQRTVSALTNEADVVIVSLHAGQEYTVTLTQLQQDLSHAAIEAGASVVIGHHPHVVQKVEEYQDGYIFYSLGNFIFDQIDPPQTREGAIASIVFRNSQIEDYSLTPVYIEHYCQPRILTTEEGKHILERMKQ